MPKRTNKYDLTYFEQGDTTSAQEEMQRWETIDAQLEALFSIMGNGVITGWDISSTDEGGLTCSVSPGSGHVGFVAVESTNIATISLVPNETNYIYAQLTNDSYWTKNVNIVSFVNELDADTDNTLYLGSVTTDANGVTTIDSSGRKELGFLELINSAMASHKHNGASGNPDPVDLSSEVQGVLNQENLPEMDASIIQAGTLDVNRLPPIDHETKLTNKGALSHAQLDSYVESLSISNQSLMGEISTTNLLQLILALKHVYPDIDEFLVNEIAFIPGISPNDYIDSENTTAEVDTRTYAEGGQHTIAGTAGEGLKAYTRKWNKKEHFNEATLNSTIILGDAVAIEVVQNELSIDEFNDVNQWAVSTNDLSAIDSQISLDNTKYVNAPSSAKLTVGSETVDVRLLLAKSFDNQDWSNYDYLNFYIYTESIQHGDLFFYLRDSEYGEQNSNKKILNRNTATINESTLTNGWKEVSIDLTGFNRENINEIGFYVSTQEGWDVSNGFDLNIDSFNLATGNLYNEDGYIRLIYEGELLSKFWRLRWDASLPSDDLSEGVSLQARTRVANNKYDLASSQWSSYSSTSGFEIELPTDNLYKCLEIEVYFTASNNKKRSATLTSVEIDYYIADSENSFEFNSQEDWKNGTTFNIDTSSSPGSILVDGVEDFGDTIYGTSGKIRQLNSDLENKYSIYGTMLPRSTIQVKNGESPSMGTITSVAKSSGGHIWIADTTNDRVIEMDMNGYVVRGFQGSFIETPKDYYGVEDAGPGSNVNYAKSLTNSEALTEELSILHSWYDSSEGDLYIVFNNNLENIYDSESVFDISKFYIKVGGHKIWLNEASAELYGVDEDNYNRWHGIDANSESGTFINQFKFTSHVLKIRLEGANKTMLNYMVDQEEPSVIISSPMPQERITNNNITVKISTYNFAVGAKEGEKGIKITLDGISQTIYSNNINFLGLSEGEHALTVELLDEEGNEYTNQEAKASTTFVVSEDEYNLPYITIINPLANQIYSSSPVSIGFKIENFPVIPSGQHIKYQIDSEPSEDSYSTNPIVIENLEIGKHTIKIWTVDDQGEALNYTYGKIESDFIVGLNINAPVQLYVDQNAIADTSGNAILNSKNLYIDICNLKLLNLYAPIDIQLVTDTIDHNEGTPTIVIAKLRSESSTVHLAGEIAEQEIVNRSQIEAGGENITLNPIYEGIETSKLIYGDKYLDGHSVIQIDMSGNIVFSNNAAVFATTKDNVIDLLGSVEKTSKTELLVGDSVNQRAIIVDTDLTTGIPTIIWQYNSDRFITDFHLNLQSNRKIDIHDNYVSEEVSYVREGMDVIWTNKSSAPVSIYSGDTTYTNFNANPNLNLYGDKFSSPVLQPGETYTFRFENEGEYPWFVYPDIVTAKIQVSKQRLSPHDQYYILESDGLDSPFSSRLIKVDSWGNIVWSFGESYMIKPRDARPMSNNKVLISV